MKKYLIIVAMLSFAVLMFAQTGLFNLSFGDSYKTASGKLTKPEVGFKLLESENGVYTFINEKDQSIDSIELYYDTKTDKLAAWRIAFNAYDDGEINAVYERVIAVHGEDIYWDEELYCDVLELSNGKSIHIGYDIYDWFTVEYYNPDYPDFGSF